MIQRILQKQINLDKQKVSILLGARRVGKTQILQKIYSLRKETTLWLNGEDMDVEKLLEQRSESNYRRILQGYHLLIIDEAQYIPDIARKMKLIIDTITPLHIILTGSSAFDLVQMGEPLVGRSITYHLHPLSYQEWKQGENSLQTQQNLEERLMFGNYPELSHFSTNEQKKAYLVELIHTYLLKDILVFEQIKSAQKLKDLLVLIAYQVGAEVSSEELGRQLGMSKNTVDKYLDLLTKVFVLYSRGGYSSNLRKEVVKSKRWYFMDNGIRNALLNDFSPFALRKDIGALWEQYVLSERIKLHTYQQKQVDSFFWRTYDQQEIDLIEIADNQILAIECKWKEKQVKIPAAFSKAYPHADFQVLHPQNYGQWLE